MSYKSNCSIWDLFPFDIDRIYEIDILPLLRNLAEREEEKDDDGISGTMVRERIRNGKVVEHVEKELKNGRWFDIDKKKPNVIENKTKTVENGNQTCIMPNCEHKSNEADTVEKLRERISDLEAQLKEANFDIDALLNTSRQIEEEKDKEIKFLRKKLDKIIRNASDLFVQRLTEAGGEIIYDKECKNKR